MSISVIIPAYNEENYIGNCLQSLRQQKLPPKEIIVVDNNCTDKTAQIAEKYGARVVKEPKQGMIFARNKGFNTARFDILARTDADTFLPPDWTKRIQQNFSKYQIDALSGTVSFYDLPFKTTPFVKLYEFLMKQILQGNPTLHGPNMSLTKIFWQKIKNKVCLDDTQVHEDINLSIHIIDNGGKIKKDNQLTVKISARRIKSNPLSFFLEYPIRLIKTLQHHK